MFFGLQQSFKFGKVVAEVAFDAAESAFTVELIRQPERDRGEGERRGPGRIGVAIAALDRVENLVQHCFAHGAVASDARTVVVAGAGALRCGNTPPSPVNRTPSAS